MTERINHADAHSVVSHKTNEQEFLNILEWLMHAQVHPRSVVSRISTMGIFTGGSFESGVKKNSHTECVLLVVVVL